MSMWNAQLQLVVMIGFPSHFRSSRASRSLDLEICATSELKFGCVRRFFAYFLWQLIVYMASLPPCEHLHGEVQTNFQTDAQNVTIP